MARLFRPTRPLLDSSGQPVIGPDGKPKRVLRTKCWYVRVYDANGKAHDISTGTEKKTDAQRKLHDLESAKGKGEPVSNRVGRITFEDAETDIVNDYKTNDRRSLDSLDGRIRLHLKPAFGGRRLSSITTADVRAYSVKRLAPVTHEDGTVTPGASHAQVNRELAALKRMFTLAVQSGKLLHRPHIPMLKERNVRTGFFEREQFELVRAHLPEHLRAVVTFCYITGWRILSEVLPLQCRQVDQRARTVSLDPHTTKNGEARVFAFGAITELRDLLTAQVQSAERLSRETEQIVSHVFHEPDGTPINHSRFRAAWKAATVAAGCPGRIPHDFRRTAVRNLVRAGVPERVAMTMTGHKTRSVFERYNITSGSDLNDAAAKLDAYLTARPERPSGGQVRQFKRRAK